MTFIARPGLPQRHSAEEPGLMLWLYGHLLVCQEPRSTVLLLEALEANGYRIVRPTLPCRVWFLEGCLGEYPDAFEAVGEAVVLDVGVRGLPCSFWKAKEAPWWGGSLLGVVQVDGHSRRDHRDDEAAVEEQPRF